MSAVLAERAVALAAKLQTWEHELTLVGKLHARPDVARCQALAVQEAAALADGVDALHASGFLDHVNPQDRNTALGQTEPIRARTARLLLHLHDGGAAQQLRRAQAQLARYCGQPPV